MCVLYVCLLCRYESPHKELTELIENDVLERNPNVRWSDIAELKEVSV